MATIKQIQDEIAEYKALIADKSVPQDEKDFAKGEIEDLEKELKKLQEKPAKKAPKKAKKKAVKKEKKPATKHTYKGKALSELDEKECDELIKEVRARREKAAKSAKKSKSKPVIEKISGNVATAVKQAIDSVPAAKINKKVITIFKRLDKDAKDLISEMKTILGKEYDTQAVKEEFEAVEKMIESLKKKYISEKAGRGKMMASRAIVVTSINDIPCIKKKVDEGKVTYRGLGIGTLANNFHAIAGEPGVRIKVDGKEYFITDSDFKKLNWDFKNEKWLNKIKFDAPHRKAGIGERVTFGDGNWRAEDSKIINSNGETVAQYSFDSNSDSFWVDNPKGGQISFETKKEMVEYFKNKH